MIIPEKTKIKAISPSVIAGLPFRLPDFKRSALIEKTDRTIHIIDRKGLIKEANLMGLSKNKT